MSARAHTTPLLLSIGAVASAWVLLQVAGPPLAGIGGPLWGPALVDGVAIGTVALAGAVAARTAGLGTGLGLPSRRAAVLGVVTGLGLPGLGGLVALALGQGTPTPATPCPTGALAPLLVASALVPGVCEELLLRGVVMDAVRRIAPGRVAVLVTALASGALHAGPISQAAAVAGGIVLGVLALRTRSAWPAAIAHVVGNAGILAAARVGLALPLPVLVAGAAIALAAALLATPPPDSPARIRPMVGHPTTGVLPAGRAS